MIEDEKELIIILNKDDMDLAMWKKRASYYPNVSVFQLPEETSPGLCQNFAVHKAKYHIIAKFDDDDFYSPYYLKEQLHAFYNTGADIVGKRDCFYYLEGENKLVETTFSQENLFVERVTDSSLMFRKEIFQTLQFPDLNRSYDNKFQQICLKNGFIIYSTSKYITPLLGDPTRRHILGVSPKRHKAYIFCRRKIDNYKIMLQD